MFLNMKYLDIVFLLFLYMHSSFIISCLFISLRNFSAIFSGILVRYDLEFLVYAFLLVHLGCSANWWAFPPPPFNPLMAL